MRWPHPWKSPHFWLAVLIVASCAVTLYSSVATYADFNYQNVDTANNAGIVTQAVSSTTFGHQAPFYESWDCLHVGRCSFMLVHTGFILYLAVPFYAILPSTLTLLVLQVLAVELAAIPLYWLTRQVTGSSGKALLAAGLFLVYAPAFSSAFTLQLVALFPLEFIGLAALWQARRYEWGFLVAVLAFLTMEVAPVFVFLIGAFFLLGGYPIALKYFRTWRLLRSAGAETSEGERYREVLARIRHQLLRSKRLLATLILMGVSVVAFLALFSFHNVWGYQVLGVARPPVLPGSGGLFYDGTATTTVSSALFSARFLATAEFWLIMFGLVGFLPLLAPRSLIVSLPWVGYTFLSSYAAFHTFGLEVNLVIVGPIFIGVAYGLVRLPWGRVTASTTETKTDAPVGDPSSPGRTARSRRLAQATRITAASVLAVVVAVNVLLSPINPVLADLNVDLKSPFAPNYFDHDLSITPGLIPAEKLVSKIPRSASVAAESPVFPLVANYPRAFVFLPNYPDQPFVSSTHLARLPFDVSTGPDFVFLEASELNTLLPPFFQNLSDTSEYGLFGYVSSTAVGPLLLYEKGYSGVASGFGPALAELNRSFVPRSGLAAGPGGHIVTTVSAPGGVEIRSNAKVNVSNPVWKSQNVTLPPGAYTVSFEIYLTATNLSGNPTLNVLHVVGSGFGPTVLNQDIDASSFTAGVWKPIVVDLNVTNPVPQFNLEGYLVDTSATISIASMTIAPSGAD